MFRKTHTASGGVSSFGRPRFSQSPLNLSSHTHEQRHTHTHQQTHTHINANTQRDTDTRMLPHTRTQRDTDTQTCIHPNTHRHTHKDIHTQTHEAIQRRKCRLQWSHCGSMLLVPISQTFTTRRDLLCGPIALDTHSSSGVSRSEEHTSELQSR